MARIKTSNLATKQKQVLECYYCNNGTQGNIKATARATGVSKNTAKRWIKLFPNYISGLTVIPTEYDPHNRLRGKYNYQTTLLSNAVYVELYNILKKYKIKWNRIVDLNNSKNSDLKNFLKNKNLIRSLTDKKLDPDYIAFLIYQFYKTDQSIATVNNNKIYHYKTLGLDFAIGDQRKGRPRQHILKYFISALNGYLLSNVRQDQEIINLKLKILRYLPDWIQKTKKAIKVRIADIGLNTKKPDWIQKMKKAIKENRLTSYIKSDYTDDPSRDLIKRVDLSPESNGFNFFNLRLYVDFKKNHITYAHKGFSFEGIFQLYKAFELSYKKFITKDVERYYRQTFVKDKDRYGYALDNLHDQLLLDYIDLSLLKEMAKTMVTL